MDGTGIRRTISAIISVAVGLAVLAWALFLIRYGWDLLQSSDAHWREGGYTIVAGGLLFLIPAVVGIVRAIIKLRPVPERR